MLKQGADFICIKKVLAKIIDCDVVQFEKRSTNSTSLIQQQLSSAFFLFVCLYFLCIYKLYQGYMLISTCLSSSNFFHSQL